MDDRERVKLLRLAISKVIKTKELEEIHDILGNVLKETEYTEKGCKCKGCRWTACHAGKE